MSNRSGEGAVGQRCSNNRSDHVGGCVHRKAPVGAYPRIASPRLAWRLIAISGDHELPVSELGDHRSSSVIELAIGNHSDSPTLRPREIEVGSNWKVLARVKQASNRLTELRLGRSLGKRLHEVANGPESDPGRLARYQDQLATGAIDVDVRIMSREAARWGDPDAAWHPNRALAAQPLKMAGPPAANRGFERVHRFVSDVDETTRAG